MKMTFRWYGEKDSIPLSYIRQIPGMTGVVTAVYDVPVGDVWPCEKIARLKSLCDAEALEMEVIESVPVHEDIKLGRPSRDRLIANYSETIRNLGKFGVKCICYNFMPVFDWLRTNLHTMAPDGSNALSYNHEELMRLDPQIDAIILGCTHYPLLMPKILKYTDPGVRIIPQGEYVANSLNDYLKRHPEMEQRCSKGGHVCYLTTENPERFGEQAQIFLHEQVKAKNITLG